MELTKQERDILLVVLDMDLAERASARELMIADTVTLNTPETLAEVLRQHDLDTQVVMDIREKVIDGITQAEFGQLATRAPRSLLSRLRDDAVRSILPRSFRWRRPTDGGV